MHYRVNAPMRVSLGEQTVDAVDWGLGGCRLKGLADLQLEEDSSHTLFCTLPFQGFNITLQTVAEVVRNDPDKNEVAFRFTLLGERETALMQHFIEDLVRGKMTEVEDTIVRIDTPVTPVPTKPDPNPAEHLPVRRWPVKQFLMTCFYFVLGLVVFGYVGVYAFATLFRLEIQSAVVSAERIEIAAPFTGKLVSVNKKVGEHVSIGSKLALVTDTNLQNSLLRAKSELADTNAQLAESEILLQEEVRRAKGYELVARNNVRQAQSQLNRMELARENALLKLQRIKTLATKGLVKREDVETAELEVESINSDLERKRIHIKELNELIEGGDSIRLYNGASFAGRLAEIKAKSARLKSLQGHYQNLVSELERKDENRPVLAPFNGRIVDSKASAGSVLKQGDPFIVFEEVGAEEISAFLTQEEASQVRIGSLANLYLPTENRWISAEVTSIDRTAGFVDEITETHRFRAPDARSAKISLKALVSDLPPTGTPATVYFIRYRNNFIMRNLQQLLETIQ